MKAVVCDSCGKGISATEAKQVGLGISEVNALFKIQVPVKIKDTCTECFTKIESMFKPEPEEKCPHGQDWDDCPDCRH